MSVSLWVVRLKSLKAHIFDSAPHLRRICRHLVLRSSVFDVETHQSESRSLGIHRILGKFHLSKPNCFRVFNVSWMFRHLIFRWLDRLYYIFIFLNQIFTVLALGASYLTIHVNSSYFVSFMALMAVISVSGCLILAPDVLTCFFVLSCCCYDLKSWFKLRVKAIVILIMSTVSPWEPFFRLLALGCMNSWFSIENKAAVKYVDKTELLKVFLRDLPMMVLHSSIIISPATDASWINKLRVC